MKKILFYIPIIAIVFLNGCYTDTIENLQTFVIQVPLSTELVNKGDSKETYTPDDLNNYEEYRENKDRIKRITLYQAAYYTNSVSPESSMDNTFKSMTFYLETGGKRYKVGQINDVQVSEFYRKPYLDKVDDDIAEEISKSLLANPKFATISVFEPNDDEYYDEILSTLVIVARIEVEL